jgi:NADPH-dependent 2,4-dienoyl-CoA reductase/sulfur reductase-like enzyme
MPFYLSGEITDWRTLAHRIRKDIEATGIHLHLDETAVEIDAAGKRIHTRTKDGATKTYPYDRLVIGTEAVPVRPSIDGIDLPNVFVLHTMDECFALQERLDQRPHSVVIVGAGYIGLEMADALRHRGIAVTAIEQLPQVMRTVDRSVAGRVEALLSERGVTVKTGTLVRSIVKKSDILPTLGRNGRLQGLCADGFSAEADTVLVVVGVRPQSDLAKTCGIHTNERGAIIVDRGIRTNLADIYAAGDCAVTWHHLLERDLYMPLGTTSHKQGRIAGENAVGGDKFFAGTLGTQSVKLFDHVVAGTGLWEEDAKQYGFDPVAVEFTTYDHKVYYPGATEMVVRIVGDRSSGALLGDQIFGTYGKEASKRIDTLATALHHRMRIDDLSELNLSYTPPLSFPWDPIQMAAQAWVAQHWCAPAI